MSKLVIKKVMPLVPGTEISFKYKNNFGNKIAININSETGLAVDALEGDLKTQVESAIRAGTLVIKEVEVAAKKQEVDSMLKELTKSATAKKPVEKAKPAVKVKPAAEKQEVAEVATDAEGVHGRRRGK